ncbi:hypothetical protein AG1IA_01497 [Rhizoctonia solani AG-1 IA]|uniref:Uncharacterized protein n=1 Tax=Thanatephorus cucumeris (strain AG1-IA) TaxID=983506 RepID=L8X610_THACA|nr:hypothetical protein AG1IA_01497 [Rhizoctonia solani AG-1 IA]
MSLGPRAMEDVLTGCSGIDSPEGLLSIFLRLRHFAVVFLYEEYSKHKRTSG